MITFRRTAFKTMPGFSTDQTALSVNRFIALRSSLMSPAGNEPLTPRHPFAAPVPLEVLYPSLYAERPSFVQRCADYLRATALTVGNLFTAHKPAC